MMPATGWLLLLGQQESLLEKYFSFILLGLVLCVGYVMWRMFPPKPPAGPASLEETLLEAEREARRRAAERRAEQQESEGQPKASEATQGKNSQDDKTNA